MHYPCDIFAAFPRIVDNAFDPAMEAASKALTKAQMGAIVAIAVCLLPVAVILPRVRRGGF